MTTYPDEMMTSTNGVIDPYKQHFGADAAGRTRG